MVKLIVNNPTPRLEFKAVFDSRKKHRAQKKGASFLQFDSL